MTMRIKLPAEVLNVNDEEIVVNLSSIHSALTDSNRKETTHDGIFIHADDMAWVLEHRPAPVDADWQDLDIHFVPVTATLPIRVVNNVYTK